MRGEFRKAFTVAMRESMLGHIPETQGLFPRITDMLLHFYVYIYIYNLCVMLLVPHPNLPRPTQALQLHGVNSIPAPSLGLPSSITGTSLQAGAPWKCRAICKPGASPLVTWRGRFWASSGISEGPVGPCPLTHMMTCPQMCLWWLFPLPPASPHSPPVLPGAIFPKNSYFQRNPDKDTCFIPGRTQAAHRVCV